ncbi:hypothetical protein GIB67_010728 [Kingdonia uniflora]|uniref:Uncharacterized protein n=1 Tax=Kingdonia uniflora TaxID=39325 RepID=A0A7J7L8U6_9MAGN|nr:hypothetical protein GIB67_010728 [Kingdonia uniflora]
MARVGWGYSYKRTTLVVCSINIVAALFVLHSLYNSLYINKTSSNVVKYTEDQIRRMEESIRVRNAAEPIELIKLVKEIEKEFFGQERVVELSRPVKIKITDEILLRLKELNGNKNVSVQQARLNH